MQLTGDTTHIGLGHHPSAAYELINKKAAVDSDKPTTCFGLHVISAVNIPKGMEPFSAFFVELNNRLPPVL